MRTDMPNLDASLFRINMPTLTPKVGSLLVAEPFLREFSFNHAVISLLEYSPGKPAMGLVLNKPTDITLGEAIDGIDEEVAVPIFRGGPVGGDRLFYIHRLEKEIPGASHLTGDLYVGGDFEKMKSYLNMGLPTEGLIRFFIGYTGWGPGQLDEEIRRHVWAVAPKPSDDVILSEDGPGYWHDVVRTMGVPYRNWLYHPVDPQLN